MHSDDAPTSSADSSLEQRVRLALERVRPALQADGGDVQLLGVDANGVVRVRFQGACQGCMAAAMTLTYGIERTLREHVPEVSRVVLA